MRNLATKLRELVRSEEGAAGVEYGIMVAAIAAGIVVAAFAIGDKVSTAFTDVNTELQKH